MPLLVGAITIGLAQPADAQRRRDRDERMARLDTTIALSRGGIVELEGADGDMIVSGWDRDEVRIRATSEEGDLRLDATSSRVELKSIGMSWGDVRYDVTVPFGTRVLLNGRSTDLSVRGTRGEVEAHTQNGDMVFADVTAVDVNSLNGDVELQRIEGVRVNLVAGDVRIDGVSGPVEVVTVSGDVDLRDIDAATVEAETVSGDVNYTGSIQRDGEYFFKTLSGDVELGVPGRPDATLRGSTFSGRLVSDFPTSQGDRRRRNRFSATWGSGSASIEVESFSGDVRIRSSR
jgi:DUF4097 and DUF4098 domain-containing protein YvlB